MHSITITEGFRQWREISRQLLLAQIPPQQTLWNQPSETNLFDTPLELPPPTTKTPPKVPPKFLELAHTISHHNSPSRWPLLYQTLHRLTLGGEKHLVHLTTDPDISQLHKMRKEISRDIHKMRAFVRFKKIGHDPLTNREQFVAWFQPDHHITPLTADFFRKRFTGMDWTIFTPTGSLTWNGQTLQHGPGVDQMNVPEEQLDDLWRTYYASIFNPARLKTKAMQAEMPKKYWHNLPEAPLIPQLISESKHRVSQMHQEAPRPTRSPGKNPYLNSLQQKSLDQQNITTKPDDHVGKPIDDLRQAASCCQACPLYQNATTTVFGEGPSNASIMIIGEQPGDQEDLLGRPFIGPAGQLLNQALTKAKIDRTKTYLTNAVKHFKFTPKGKHRLHQSPNLDEIHRCKPWLIAEILQVQPQTIILLGATAARSLIDPNFKISQSRGLIPNPYLAPKMIATYHPSFLLRIQDPKERNIQYQKFLQDLELAQLSPE